MLEQLDNFNLQAKLRAIRGMTSRVNHTPLKSQNNCNKPRKIIKMIQDKKDQNMLQTTLIPNMS
jgi:hypothetical protein